MNAPTRETLAPLPAQPAGVPWPTAAWQQAGVEEGPYGAHWWLGLAGPGSFSANGYDGQYTVVVPELDMVVVRHGKTPLDVKANPKTWIAQVVDCFRSD